MSRNVTDSLVLALTGRERVLGRFWQNVTRSDDESCWIWCGITRKGYGALSVERRRVAAHRFLYLLLVGPVPAGLELDHLCRNRACVNPAHLEPVTTRENVLRGEGITARLARNTHCPAGHPWNERNTLIPPSGGRQCRECRRQRQRSPEFMEGQRERQTRMRQRRRLERALKQSVVSSGAGQSSDPVESQPAPLPVQLCLETSATALVRSGVAA